jgi:hypothetical protein
MNKKILSVGISLILILGLFVIMGFASAQKNDLVNFDSNLELVEEDDLDFEETSDNVEGIVKPICANAENCNCENKENCMKNINSGCNGQCFKYSDNTRSTCPKLQERKTCGCSLNQEARQCPFATN